MVLLRNLNNATGIVSFMWECGSEFIEQLARRTDGGDCDAPGIALEPINCRFVFCVK